MLHRLKNIYVGNLVFLLSDIGLCNGSWRTAGQIGRSISLIFTRRRLWWVFEEVKIKWSNLFVRKCPKSRYSNHNQRWRLVFVLHNGSWMKLNFFFFSLITNLFYTIIEGVKTVKISKFMFIVFSSSNLEL